MNHFVYALVDGGDVRYVGYTSRLAVRRKTHARAHPDWRLLTLGAYSSPEIGLDRERWWIKRLFEMGSPLENVLAGGQTGYLGEHSHITRKRMSRAALGKPKSREAIRKSADARRGQKRTPEQCARILSGRGYGGLPMGYKHTSETKVKMSVARSAWWARQKSKEG